MIKYISIVLILISSSSEATQFCQTSVNSVFSSQHQNIQDLQSKCLQGGGHMQVGDQERKMSCTSYTNVMTQVNSALSQCEASVQEKNVCEISGGTWMTGRSGYPWIGSCESNCPGGTKQFTDLYTMANSCSCLNNQNIMIPLGSNDVSSCGNQIVENNCAKLIPGINDDEVAACENQNNIQAQIAENEAQAAINAGEIADSDLSTRIAQAIADGETSCTNALTRVQSACDPAKVSNLSSAGNPVTEGSGQSACETTLQTSQTGFETAAQREGACRTARSEVSSSCLPRSAAKTGTAPITCVGSGPVQGCTSQPTTKTGSGEISNYASTNAQADEAERAFLDKVNQLRNALARVRDSARSCIAAFSKQNDDDGSGSPNTKVATFDDPAGPSNPSDEGDKEGELANGKPSAGDILSGIGTLASGLNTGGSESYEPNLPSRPSFKTTNSRGIESGFNGGGSGGASLSSDRSLDLGANARPGGDDSRGLPDTNGSRGNNSAFNAQNGANPGNGQGGQAGAGGQTNPQSARLAASEGSSNNGSGRRGSRRGSDKGRTLINGYKNVKPTDGGGSLSMKPSAFKKYSRNFLKGRLAEARKRHGIKTPLKFMNGSFVKDFLAMKNSKGFTARQAAMEKFWKGESSARTDELECERLRECHSSKTASIFKLMNFRVMKTMYKVEH